MKLKEKISLEEVCGQTYKIRVIEASEHGKDALTHYLQNHKNGISQFYKKEAVHHIKRALEYKFPDEDITNKVAEDALQYMLFDFKNEVPFPEPEKPNSNLLIYLLALEGFGLRCKS